MKRKVGSIVALLAILMLVFTSAPLANTELATAAPSPDTLGVPSVPSPTAAALSGYDVTDMAVASDGHTIYVIADGKVYKSIDIGCTFEACPVPAGFAAPAVNLAVAPDNPNVIAVSDNSANEVVWLSTTGCGSWASLPTPCAGGDTLTDLALSPATAGTILSRYVFATIADNAANITTKGDVKMIGGVASWASVGVTSTHDYMAIQVTPGFVGDRCICVVGVPASAAVAPGVDYQIININTSMVVQTVQFVPPGTTTDFQSPAAGSSIIYADIALPMDFDCTTPGYQRAYVGICSFTCQATDDVYRVDGPIFSRLNVAGGTGVCIRSIDYAGTTTSGKLIAGEHATPMVWHTTTPFLNSPTWFAATTPPTGSGDVVVGMAPDVLTSQRCYAGTSGGASGFFISIDNAYTFDYICPCECTEWEPVTVTWTGSSPETWTGDCGDTVTIDSINPGTAVSITSSISCSPNCKVSYTWEVTESSGAQGPWTGNDLPAKFTPTSPGSFTVVLNASCDDTPCPPCEIVIRINETQPSCVEDLCITWSDITVDAFATGGWQTVPFPVYENPVYEGENRICVRVHNIGCISADNVEVNVYWYDFSTGIPWPGGWNFIDSTTISSIPSGGEEIVCFDWIPTGGVIGHRCLFATAECASDPIISYYPWVDNNVAQRNVDIIRLTLPQTEPYITEVVLNPIEEPGERDLIVELLGAPKGASVELLIPPTVQIGKIEGAPSAKEPASRWALSCSCQPEWQIPVTSALDGADTTAVVSDFVCDKVEVVKLKITVPPDVAEGGGFTIKLTETLNGEKFGEATFIVQY